MTGDDLGLVVVVVAGIALLPHRIPFGYQPPPTTEETHQ